MRKTWLFGAVAALMSFAVADGVGAQAQSTPGPGGRQADTVKVTGCLQQRGSMASANGSVGTSGAAGRTTTGTPGTSTAGFVLLNARPELGSGGGVTPDATPAPAGLSGTAPATAAKNATDTGRVAPPSAAGANAAAGHNESGLYYLDGQNDQLRDHVGHQVEITGLLSPGPGPAAEGEARVRPADPSDTLSNGRSEATTPGVNSRGSLAGGATPTGGATVTGTTAAAIAGLSKDATAGARLDVQSVRMIAPSCSSR